MEVLKTLIGETVSDAYITDDGRTIVIELQSGRAVSITWDEDTQEFIVIEDIMGN
ncbi:MAG: hypothetical protein KatS3mg083_642 [Candidatus Dojkabacteria bacterium]|nr:MAG: hypothetical protein KatS3mg083_642 [Candidatus Dojkabacteria bacterium]